MSVAIGSRVSHYLLTRRLGAGGMGEVFLARDTSLDRLVAIKFLAVPAEPEARRRLLREARASASLDHASICAVYEVGTDPDGGDFIVMQYVEGETLAVRLQDGRLPPTEALTTAARIAEAIAAAHRAGVVHRDLKPQNIIITPAGTPKLLDFGLAKRVAGTRAEADALTASHVTQPYELVGTPAYMSPEQIRNQPADVRSDIFGLGCVLYECLTGRRAFAGATTPDVFAQVLQTTPPAPSSLVPELGPAHDALCARLLQKSPDDRVQTADEALGAIRALIPGTLAGESLPQTAVRPSRRMSRAALVSIALLGVAVVALGVWQWRRTTSLPPPTPEAARWYARGVEALREGSFAGARGALEEAVRLFPQYPQAYSRLAEACAELDDERQAQAALLRMGSVAPDRRRLPAGDQLRLKAVESSVLRDHPQAIVSHQAIAKNAPGDSGAWVDLGRAQEAAGQRTAARESYAKAVTLDGQYAAARLRLGAVQAQGGETAAALASLDEAIRLYRTAANVEGEAEAQLRKGLMFTNTGKFAAARDTLTAARQLAADPRYLSQRTRAQFELARLASTEGRFSEAEAIARAAVEDATAAGLHTIAANGLIDLGTALSQITGRAEDARTQLDRARQLAAAQGATRTEMRAALQLASLHLQLSKPRDAVALAEPPQRYFAANRYLRFDATAKIILSRAYEGLERYDDASRLAAEALQFAESIGDSGMAANALEPFAGTLTKLGRLPEALTHRERIDQIHRERNQHSALAFDLANHAELLILLGRPAEAESLLAEIDRRIAAKAEAYVPRARRVALLRALRAATERRFTEVEPLAKPALLPPDKKPDDTALFARALIEQARAELGTATTTAEAVAALPAAASSPAVRRELRYWAAQALLTRREFAAARALVAEGLSAQGAEGNHELRWRLAALAARAEAADSATMRAHAHELLQKLTTAWAGSAAAYAARPDLASLRKSIS